jgi:hypothetical protein
MLKHASGLWVRVAGVLLAFDGVILLWLGLAFVAALAMFQPDDREASGPDWVLAVSLCLLGAAAIGVGIEAVRLRRHARLAGLGIALVTSVLLLAPFIVGSPMERGELVMLVIGLAVQAAVVFILVQWTDTVSSAAGTRGIG